MSDERCSYHGTGGGMTFDPALNAEAIRQAAEHLWRTPPPGPMPKQRHGSLRRRLGFWLIRLGRRVGSIPEPHRPWPAQHFDHIHVSMAESDSSPAQPAKETR